MARMISFHRMTECIPECFELVVDFILFSSLNMLVRNFGLWHVISVCTYTTYLDLTAFLSLSYIVQFHHIATLNRPLSQGVICFAFPKDIRGFCASLFGSLVDFFSFMLDCNFL